MSTQAGNTCVIADLVPENERMAFLPQYFGRHLMRGEATVYSWAATLSVDYGRSTGFRTVGFTWHRPGVKNSMFSVTETDSIVR
ncbi:hypothetical protein P3T24_006497 [Paraburkholderia sp. GAS33]|uniref:hypothetical protein n=1 Tax=Paraburkholderia sp. GAS33 TaxID=3035130 RepID=UPI003D1E1547